MQTKVLNIAGAFSLVLLLFCFAISADELIREGTTDEKLFPAQTVDVQKILADRKEAQNRLLKGTSEPLQPVQHKELMGILTEIEKAYDKREGHEKFKTYSRQQKLETVAYALKEGMHTSEALQAIINDSRLLDRRLTPLMIKVIQKAEGEELFRALTVVNRLPPDKELLAPLMDSLLKNIYYVSGGPLSIHSTFVEAAKAIYKITDGKIGLSGPNIDRIYYKPEKQNLIEKWRQTYNAEYKSGK
jgi:hypothetical protein